LVLWHDGRPLTAADVAFMFDYLKGHPHPWVDVRPVQKVEVIDPRTVRVILARPYAAFLAEIAGSMFILPRHIWQEVKEVKGLDMLDGTPILDLKPHITAPPSDLPR
jgi:peptide/nickel transport system substrate-binding protein